MVALAVAGDADWLRIRYTRPVPRSRPPLTDFLLSLGIAPDTIEALRLDTLGRLLLASLLGGMIGMEREVTGKPAGLRTNMLICVGAALLTELSFRLAAFGVAGGFRADPARLAAQIIPGIGFIGAGAILHGKGKVTGLTTAATLWVVTAIGIAVGSKAYVEAIGTTMMVLFTLLLLAKFEHWLRFRRSHRRYVAAVRHGQEPLHRLEEAVQAGKLQVRIEGMERTEDGVEVTIRATGSLAEHDRLVRRLLHDDDVRRVKRV